MSSSSESARTRVLWRSKIIACLGTIELAPLHGIPQNDSFGIRRMQSSLSWIEWLDRLDRVLKGAREDVRALATDASPEGLAAMERCKRQLSALTSDLQLLDRSVIAPRSGNTDRASNLQRALDTTLFHLGTAAAAPAAAPHGTRERLLTAIDSALRDSYYEAAMLLEPRRALPERRAGLS